MAEQKYDEKDEKQFDEKNEKELMKHEEKVEQQDKLSSIVWAAILIWAGIAFLSVNMGWFDALLNSQFFTRILPENMTIFEPGVWSIIMFGAGIILLLEVVARLLLPQFHRHIGGTLILAAVFIGVGLGNFFGWDIIWPLVLIAVGVGVLLGGITRRK
jgi:hypothetical protein